MIFSRKHLAIASLITVLLSRGAASQCLITRDVDACPANNWAEELYCLMAQNMLRTIMDCVQIKPNANEFLICRAPDDHKFNDHEDYYLSSTTKTGQLCLTPRTILIQGPAGMQNFWKLGIQGALQACPENDPDFHNCLCEQNVNEQSLLLLAQYFKQPLGGTKQDLSCSSLLSKRNFLDDIAETPHIHEARDALNVHNRIQARASDFMLDQYGRPVYANGQVGYRLPYYDQYIWDGEAARRCYVHPEVKDVFSCRTWLLDTPVTSALSVLPTKANYNQVFTPSASVMPSATAAPETTDIPSEQIVASGEAPGERSAAPTPTAGTNSGGSMVSLLPLTFVLLTAACAVLVS